MKSLILYRSYLGTTKKYALWLKEKIEADIATFYEVPDESLKKYDQIIVMSGTYAGQMPLVKFLKKKWPLIFQKKVVVIAVGAAPEDDEASLVAYHLIPQNIRNKISYFKIPGKILAVNQDQVRVENLQKIIKSLS